MFDIKPMDKFIQHNVQENLDQMFTIQLCDDNGIRQSLLEKLKEIGVIDGDTIIEIVKDYNNAVSKLKESIFSDIGEIKLNFIKYPNFLAENSFPNLKISDYRTVIQLYWSYDYRSYFKFINRKKNYKTLFKSLTDSCFGEKFHRRKKYPIVIVTDEINDGLKQLINELIGE